MCGEVVCGHKSECYHISTSVNITNLFGPNFKAGDIDRSRPIVRVAIEVNQSISEEKARMINTNQENQRILHSLSEYNSDITLIHEYLSLSTANQIYTTVFMDEYLGGQQHN